jgi:hypothetical protein
MIGELLQATRQIDSAPPICVESIVLGTGPSFFDAIRRPLPPGKRYGCGIASRHVELDVYALGDEVHWNHAPLGTTVYITQRVRDGHPESAYLAYPEDELPHGGSSGGMALSLACRDHDVVGLIGFDSQGMPDEFVAAFRALLTWWKARGKRMVSLMPACAFDDLLERP